MISEHLKDYQVILASKSPRRSQLLHELGLNFSIGHKETPEEVYPKNLRPEEVAEYLSKLKAESYNEELSNAKTIVITADTIVCVDNEILGKPANKQEAFDMLMKLSSKSHNVITGVSIFNKNKHITFSTSTKVYFKTLKEQEINYYIDNFKPFDKAGAYGIQEWIGMTSIEKIDGSYFNVVGLPVQKLYTELMKF